VERWEKQYLASTGEGKPSRYQRMLDLARWLKENVPEEDSSAGAGTGLVHGDFRADNLVFHPTEDRVIGVIDWELSTLGNQMCDVAYSCLPYIFDATPSERTSYGGFQHTGIPDGIPQLEEYLSVYCSFSVSIKYPYSRLAEWIRHITLVVFFPPLF
jgi:acyl-CoA dehydrogenase